MTVKRPAPSPAVTVKVARLPHGAGLPLPAYQTPGSAGLDLLAAIAGDVALFIAPGDRVAVPTGLALELPPGTEAQVRPRSGLALKQGLTILNAPGTIDSDYRGEVQVILINLGQETATIRRGDRIAQMVIAPVTHARLVEAPILSATGRGAGGFGSTGRTVMAEEKIPRAETKKKKPIPSKPRAGARGSNPMQRNKPPRSR